MTRPDQLASQGPRLTRPYVVGGVPTTVMPAARPPLDHIRWVAIATDGTFDVHYSDPQMEFHQHRWYQREVHRAVRAAIDPIRILNPEDVKLRHCPTGRYGVFLRLELAHTAPDWPINPVGAQMLLAALSLDVPVLGCLPCFGQFDPSTRLYRSLTDEQLAELKALHRTASERR